MPKKGHDNWIPLDTISAPVYRSDEDQFDFTDTPPEESETAYEYQLNDLLIKSYQTSGSAGDVVPTEELSLNYEVIKWTYEETSAVLEGDWNFDG